MTGPFDGHLEPGERPALLIVDVVMAYLDRTSPLDCPTAAAALAVNDRLVAAARAASIPVVFTNVEYQADGADGGLFYRKIPALAVFLKGSPLGASPSSLQSAPKEIVVTKQYASAFFATSLASTLRSLRVDTLLITGFSTSGCFRARALDALQHGFAPFVVADACADRDLGPQANLSICRRNMQRCLTTPPQPAFSAQQLKESLLQPDEARLCVLRQLTRIFTSKPPVRFRPSLRNSAGQERAHSRTFQDISNLPESGRSFSLRRPDGKRPLLDI